MESWNSFQTWMNDNKEKENERNKRRTPNEVKIKEKKNLLGWRLCAGDGGGLEPLWKAGVVGVGVGGASSGGVGGAAAASRRSSSIWRWYSAHMRRISSSRARSSSSCCCSRRRSSWACPIKNSKYLEFSWLTNQRMAFRGCCCRCCFHAFYGENRQWLVLLFSFIGSTNQKVPP